MFLDSGTSDHSICNKDLFIPGTYREDRHFLETGSREVLLSEGRGSVLASLDDGKENHTDITLSDVRYLSSLKYNLISTRSLWQGGIEVLLRTTENASQLLYDGEVIGLADLKDEQYILRANSHPAVQTMFTSSKTTSFSIWHERLGHLSYTQMIKLLELATGLSFSGSPPTGICGPCMKAKHKKKVNRTTRTQATEFLSIVSSDVGGLFPPTIYGEIFYSLFQDDATGAICVYLMKSKGEVPAKYRQFRAWAENQSERKLKVLRGDSGGEYTSTEFQDELKETGVEWQVRSPYIPEQNRKAERQNYTLMTMVRSIMAAQLLPRVLWGEILKTFVYL